MIGKRKRDTSVVSRSKAGDNERKSSATTNPDAHDIFRKFFEAEFQPLDLPAPKSARVDESDSEENEDNYDSQGSGSESESELELEWDGLTDEEDEDEEEEEVDEDEDDEVEVEVVEYLAPSKAGNLMDKKARKAFMTAKPPSLSTEAKTTTNRSTKTKTKAEDEEEKTSEAQNLKNDLALQRLLKESHLLESASELAPTGKNRHKALDLRMQELGAKKSLYHQKMPSSIRKGIKAKAATKEEKRRREARENGIILEKPAPKFKGSSGRRERGVGGPSIGKFAGGTLNLTKRDIAVVQKSRKGGKVRRKGRR
ncbi:hypothetical protein ARAM_002852 [Aspergillus rambellii]|uniref:Protein FAF1 n=1 Tax=Aspergillus rambellii TaxID=308745 RepID=A0A0F8VKH7_9EURO|nr:hypothetical protein ARAM_002852 [Aspergillus rambellii]